MSAKQNSSEELCLDVEADIALAKTQANSLKELEKPLGGKSHENTSSLASQDKIMQLESDLNSVDNNLAALMIDYFHKPLVTHLRSGMGPSHSPYVFLLDAMHKTQQHIRGAMKSNVEVSVRVPNPIYLTSTKPVLVVDLDETLLHSEAGRKAGDQVVTISAIGSGKVSFTVIMRPFAREFLQAVKEFYTVVLFTASDKAYADKVLKLIDPQDNVFALKLYKHSCLSIDNHFNIKDLRMFRNIPTDEIIILDNNPVCYLLQPHNAIPITSFYFDADDIELKKLAVLLKHIAPVKNKKEALKEYFYTDHISSTRDFGELVDSILKASGHI